jgi:hypothetical protein
MRPNDGESVHLRNVDLLLRDYMAPCPKRRFHTRHHDNLKSQKIVNCGWIQTWRNEAEKNVLFQYFPTQSDNSHAYPTQTNRASLEQSTVSTLEYEATTAHISVISRQTGKQKLETTGSNRFPFDVPVVPGNKDNLSVLGPYKVSGLGDRAIEVRFPSEAPVSRPALRSTQWVQWVPRVLSPGLKRGRGVTLTTHPHPVSRSKMSRSYNSSPPKRLRGV